ncbi:hypothetical protein LARI1_G008556 [Lachnellula arida]|uniref:Uncharacterized protein n=1 Tax=Lachnellula arida TaxID=1316785 RepID=A0A8T9B2U5_9HELO|nr:hypothetical protein LARI1_G008556 [Lachnellula arida]
MYEFSNRYSFWERNEIRRIETLSNHQVWIELRDIMYGYDYSWYMIAQYLQTRLDAGVLKLDHFESGNILYEWNVLCDEKITWKLFGRPSFSNYSFNKACLINLKTIPTQAGLGYQGIKFAIINLDPGPLVGIIAADYAVKEAGEQEAEFRAKGTLGYFYAEGPEFRLDYIHSRVEY